MFSSNQVSESLRALGMTQLCLSRLARVPNDRLSRFLSGSLELRPAEVDRLGETLENCLQIEKGKGRLASNTPIDWDRVVVVNDPIAGETRFQFEGDFDFCLDRHPVLSVLIPLDVLRSLVSAGPLQFLKIYQTEVVGLLGLMVRNSNTSSDNRAVAQSLLDLACNQGVSADD